MGIKVEFNPDLALRDISEFKNGNRKIEEFIPENLEVGKVYEFLKSGQRLFYLSDSEFWGNGQIPLCRTNGKEELSRPIASIKILEVTHFLEQGEIWTKGKYRVVEIFDENNPKINFEACKRI
ncbi:MAG: hypothetical protein US30_C0019G0005 [Candidatus Moranbacteria bacterium GW2011_GWF2_36_839]|nr:MAG: hypothetical protein US27_C0020G0025 [Candidatus Moranbacteria bacterium GW2011_GWF1_36_78]KKQ16302.1 MAG: hypothetical protein US30_C0019G0005 [Candidatus Moranbacteria bacterium GW2011_GWF2_36_839]HAT74180.1 hypothetical protein [Candidatus Moranbacteria bacterium]HBY10637.1 hypothetical protein [Candidatus Moranbacteria bacterium]